LEVDGRLETPVGKDGWDTVALPALPRWIKLSRETLLEEKADLRTIPWAPELRFLANARVGVPLSDLLKLQEFFASGGRSRLVVPLKERSLQIFGDEKRLDRLWQGSTLFGEGRLSLEMLRCRSAPVPLAWSRDAISNGPLIVLENAATWHSFRDWNRQQHLFGAVVYGDGNCFADGVGFLADIFSEQGDRRQVVYFGDLDPQGLRIPQLASAYAQHLGLPPIEPHLPSYRSLLQLGRNKTTSLNNSEPVRREDCDWLGELADEAWTILAAGHRLAQEHVGWEFLQSQLDRNGQSRQHAGQST
jgi:hypothetical protein